MMLADGSDYPRLVGDIGGTHARFAQVRSPRAAPEVVAQYPCADFATLWDALQRYLGEHAATPPRAAAIGIATPITGDHVQMTNHHWSFSIRELQRRLGVERLVVLNDFSALALSLPVLPADQLRQVGGGQAVAGAPMGLIGPGTGLGVSGLLPMPDGGGFVPINGEGGHVTLASFDPTEAAVLDHLHRRFGHVSAERALSGPGLVNLHRAICAVRGEVPLDLSAPQITDAALRTGDAACVQTLTMFCGLLGSVAGNVALTLGARGGVYVGGGIVPKLGQWFDRSAFRERFESKGRFSAYLRAIPTFVIEASKSPALIGAGRALDLRLSSASGS